MHNLGHRLRNFKARRGELIVSQRKSGKQKRINSQENFPVLKPNAAGIDIGAAEIFVAVPPDRTVKPVRSFRAFTEDLHRLADWLRSCHVGTVAMEFTSVYWIPLFQILESRGFEVCLVNAPYFQNVPGRKTDVSDCQWLRDLHAVGLLRGSFRRADEVCVLRSLLRHWNGLIQMAATHVLRMQKALDQMKLQIHRVISDITGLKIINAVLEGERDTKVLAELRNGRIKASEETIMKSMVGDYQREHLFTLRQCLMAYRNYQQPITDCDKEIEDQLRQFHDKADLKSKPLALPKVRRKKILNNTPSFDPRVHFHLAMHLTHVTPRACGLDEEVLFRLSTSW